MLWLTIRRARAHKQCYTYINQCLVEEHFYYIGTLWTRLIPMSTITAHSAAVAAMNLSAGNHARNEDPRNPRNAEWAREWASEVVERYDIWGQNQCGSSLGMKINAWELQTGLIPLLRTTAPLGIKYQEIPFQWDLHRDCVQSLPFSYSNNIHNTRSQWPYRLAFYRSCIIYSLSKL